MGIYIYHMQGNADTPLYYLFKAQIATFVYVDDRNIFSYFECKT